MAHRSAPPDPRLLFVTGGLSVKEIAAKYKGHPGYSARTLFRRCAAEKWNEQRVAHEANVVTQAVEKDLGAGTAAAPAAVPTGTTSGAPPPAATAGPTAPPATPPDGGDLWAAATERALVLLAQEQSDEVLEELRLLRSARMTALRGAECAISESTMWLAAHVSTLSTTGGTAPHGEAEVAVAYKKIKPATRAAMMGMLQQASATLRGLMASNPIVSAQQQFLALRLLDARLRHMEMRMDGSMPPERVKLETTRQVKDFLEAAEAQMPNSDFNRLLNVFEAWARRLGIEETGGDLQ